MEDTSELVSAKSTPLWVWVQAARVKTLTAAVIPVLAGSALAYKETGNHTWWITVFAILATLCIQIGTNFVNDAVDFSKGTDSHTRLGPPRVTQQGLLTSKKVLFGAGVMFLLSVGFGLPLVIHGGAPILAIGLLSIFFGYAYTSGPLPLAYNGLGELFVVIFFGLIAVGGMFYLHTSSYSAPAFLMGLQIGFLSTLLIAINNLRDINGDRDSKKKTLAVIFGERFARNEIAFVALAPFIIGIAWLNISISSFIFPLVLTPLALKIVRDLRSIEPSIVFNDYLLLAATLHALFGIILSGCLIWA